jgi:hypothetical protein
MYKMRNKKLNNLFLMLSILVAHTLTLTYWLSKETEESLKKSQNNAKVFFEKNSALPIFKMDTLIKKTIIPMRY